MIIARAPVRIGIVGGGTDLPSYYSRWGCQLLYLAIDRYISVGVEPRSVDAPRSAFVDEALRWAGADNLCAQVFSEVPKSCGLGTSGAVLVALLSAAIDSEDPALIADAACRVEIDHLKRCVGKQDQYASAFGGLGELVICKDGTAYVNPQPDGMAHALASHLLMVYVGGARDAGSILADQERGTLALDPMVVEGLHDARHSVGVVLGALVKEDWATLGREFSAQWSRKTARCPLATNDAIGAAMAQVIEAGALGAKVSGAGGGGFITAVCDDVQRVSEKLRRQGLTVWHVKPSNGGVRHVVRW